MKTQKKVAFGEDDEGKGELNWSAGWALPFGTALYLRFAPTEPRTGFGSLGDDRLARFRYHADPLREI
jgi:hypothetical protein